MCEKNRKKIFGKNKPKTLDKKTQAKKKQAKTYFGEKSLGKKISIKKYFWAQS